MDSVEDYDFGFGDEIISPEGAKSDGEEKETEEKPAEKKSAGERPAEEPTKQEPQVEKEIKISPDLVKDAQDLGEFLKKNRGAEDLAIKLATMINEKASKQQENLDNALDKIYYATPEGQQVKKVLDRYGKHGMTKEAAMLQVQDMAKYQVHFDQRMGGGEAPHPGLRLSEEDKKILRVIGNTPEQFYKDAQEVLKGNNCHYLSTGGIEIELDIPMEPKGAK